LIACGNRFNSILAAVMPFFLILKDLAQGLLPSSTSKSTLKKPSDALIYFYSDAPPKIDTVHRREPNLGQTERMFRCAHKQREKGAFSDESPGAMPTSFNRGHLFFCSAPDLTVSPSRASDTL
jgi:hypothetical protein